MARARRIGILTGGGDVPGLNAVIKSVVYRASEIGYDVLGIRRGWMGLTHMRQGLEFDSDFIRPLNRANTRGIDRTGGTSERSSSAAALACPNGCAAAYVIVPSPSRSETVCRSVKPTPSKYTVTASWFVVVAGENDRMLGADSTSRYEGCRRFAGRTTARAANEPGPPEIRTV
jgi:hypothetical protein